MDFIFFNYPVFKELPASILFLLLGANIKKLPDNFPKSQESQLVILWSCVAKGT